ncbi:MAG: D-cysteine desulfhydrase [Anaerolineales bacterium]
MLPRTLLAHLPTPLESLPRLSSQLGIRLLIKRDDQTGLFLGGNKTRKLEFLLAEAQANGAKTLITAGAVQSNHCRQTAAAAARAGLGCVLVLAGEPPATPQGNYLLDGLLNAEIVWARDFAERDAVLQAAFQRLWEAGKRPYLIPYGGSNPVGAAAYALAFDELLLQTDAPDWVVFASSSGGTHAGLTLGARRRGATTRVLGISVDETQAVLQARVANLANRTADLLGERLHWQPEEILVNADFLGGGYGVLGAPEVEAIRRFARLEAILLDPVYTGRAAAGLLALARTGAFASGETVVFWHTGGAPAVFAEKYAAHGLV